MLTAAFELFRKEWTAVRSALASFVIVTLVVLSLTWAAFHWYYGSRLDDAEKRAGQWQGDAAYWKDQASHPKCPECPKVPERNATTDTKKKPTAHRTTPPAIQTPTQSCPNGICIGGNNQGNPTVNNYGPP